MKRRQVRELAFQILYQIDVGKNEVEEALEQRLNDFPLDKKGKEFCTKLVKGTIAKLNEIDELIQKYAIGWKLERMLSVDRNLLRMAVFEMVYCEDIPLKVTLNEAIELAKVFGTEDSPKFINGILDKIMKYCGD